MTENFVKMNAERRTPNAEPQSCPQFTIIVPAYNTAKYITKCLDSLINQDIPERNYEILITDDGSTDETGKICDSYAERYPFIHVTHTENHGASHARNVALPKCKGKYLTFCDTDDFVSPQLISVLTRAVDIFRQPDAVVFKHFHSRNFPKNGFPVYDIENMKFSDANITDAEELCFRIVQSTVVGGFTWNKLIKTELAQDCLFDENLKVCMDQEWLIRLFTQNSDVKVYFIDYFLYCYVQVPNFGQTRDPKRIYREDGMNRFILASEKELSIDNLSLRVKKIINGNIYSSTVNTLYHNDVKFSIEVYRKLKMYMRKNAAIYYLGSSRMIDKIKTFIKQCLVFLHIHKPRRK